mgnify:CR=1 FL=1
MSKGKCVLAYSGGMDSTISVVWIKENYDLDVITLTVDLGAGPEIEGVAEKAKKAGAIDSVILDVKDEFVDEYIFPGLKAGAMYEDVFGLSTAFARPLMSKKIVETALNNKINVITPNKPLISTHGDYLSKLAERNKVNLEFEASVAGGIPILRTIYSAITQMTETFTKSEGNKKNVVLVEYPRKGSWAVGFATKDNDGEISKKANRKLVNVFVPTTPNPTSGFLLMFPKEEVVYLDLTFEEASKFIGSAGTSNPK